MEVFSNNSRKGTQSTEVPHRQQHSTYLVVWPEKSLLFHAVYPLSGNFFLNAVFLITISSTVKTPAYWQPLLSYQPCSQHMASVHLIGLDKPAHNGNKDMTVRLKGDWHPEWQQRGWESKETQW